MRIDSHQHFWRYDPQQHDWMTDAMDVLRRDYLPPELAPQLEDAGFDATIAVQARQSLAETDWLLGIAEENDFVHGVVGWVDILSPDLRGELERFAPHPALVGVRHVVHDEPDDGFMLRPEFRRGIGQLAEFCLTYDLLLFPRHLSVAAELVREFPEQPFVLDHVGKPAIADRGFSPWREDLAALAKLENVWCKVSGMVTEAAWNGWRPEDFRPYLDIVLQAFGPDRVMIGSDWPVCTLAGRYGEVMAIVLDYVESCTPDEREAILGGNCARFYGVGDDPR